MKATRGLEKPCYFQISQRTTMGDAGSFIPCKSSCFFCPWDLLTVLVSLQLFSFQVFPHLHPHSLILYALPTVVSMGCFPISVITKHINLFPCSYSFQHPYFWCCLFILQMEWSLTNLNSYLNLTLNPSLT